MTQKNNILFSTKLLQQYQKKLPNQQASSSSSAISTPRKSTSETRAENRKNRNRESRASRRRSISTDEEIDEGRDSRTITGRRRTKFKILVSNILGQIQTDWSPDLAVRGSLVEGEEKEGKENERKRSSRSSRSKCSNIPLRSQSFRYPTCPDRRSLQTVRDVYRQGPIFDFRRETEEERRANLSFETAISGTFRSQSHQELNPELIRSEKPLWKVSYFFGLGFVSVRGMSTIRSTDQVLGPQV